MLLSKVHPACHNVVNGIKPGNNSGTAHYLSVSGCGYKVGGSCEFHVASRGVTINFDFPAGGGEGHVLIVPKKSLKIFLARFAFLCFIN